MKRTPKEMMHRHKCQEKNLEEGKEEEEQLQCKDKKKDKKERWR